MLPGCALWYNHADYASSPLRADLLSVGVLLAIFLRPCPGAGIGFQHQSSSVPDPNPFSAQRTNGSQIIFHWQIFLRPPSHLIRPFHPLAARRSSPRSPRLHKACAFSSPVINPLTGLTVSDPAILNRRPLAIKISNYPRLIRPQFGLNLADVVYEYYIEWLDTRFIAIFYSHDATQVGPVRSGRYFDEHITRMYHSYYVFNFADPREYSYYLGGDLEKFLVTPGCNTCTCPPFFVDKVSTEIIGYPSFGDLFQHGQFQPVPAPEEVRTTPNSLCATVFSVAALSPGGFAVNRIYTHYSICDYNYWEYNPATGRYLRFQEISPNQKLQPCR